MRNNRALFAFVILASWGIPVAAHAAGTARRPAPDPAQLLDRALRPPETAYRGRLMVVRWFGKQSRAEEVNVFYDPSNRYRWEFLTPDGRMERIVVSDGTHEWVEFPRQHRILKGDAIKSGPKRIRPETERELLVRNYDLLLAGEDKIVGRPAWVLHLSPKTAQKFHEKLWIDRETGVILEAKRFLPQRKSASLSRFSQFEPARDLPERLFQIEPDSAARIDDHGLDPDFLSLEELNQTLGKSVNFPKELPGGFVFESADFLPLKGTTVRCLRYTDGLSALSIFETDRPVRLTRPEPLQAMVPIPLPGPFQFSSSGRVLTWKSKLGRHYTLIGEVSRELLQQISAQLQ